ncbi:hypothetical protein [Vibrio parahaemolyticus]|uniref:hypothetical protein n=1 Tax=Vibrio parahaemolyticus TaxID=670 RepID=UPI003298E3AF
MDTPVFNTKLERYVAVISLILERFVQPNKYLVPIWLCLLLTIVILPKTAYGDQKVKREITPEVVAELTSFGETVAQFLRFWYPNELQPVNESDCKDITGKVWLGEFDVLSPLPEKIQNHIESIYKDIGVVWKFAPPCPEIDPSVERIAIIASELAKAAASYEYALEVRREGETEQQSAVCVPGEMRERCEFELLDVSYGSESFNKPKTLRLKAGLSHCNVSESFLGASCLHEQSTLVNLASFWHQAVSAATDIRFSEGNQYYQMSDQDMKRDALVRADSKRRLKSFQRALLPYSQWIDSRALIEGLALMNLDPCTVQTIQESGNDTDGCSTHARNPYPTGELHEEQLVKLPDRKTCRRLLSPEDVNFYNCSLRRDFFVALRTAHLTGFFAQKLLLAQKNASMQSDADRTQVLQLAVSVARLTPVAQSWLPLDVTKINLFSKANSDFLESLGSSDDMNSRLGVSLKAKNDPHSKEENQCTPVFSYNPYLVDKKQLNEPPSAKDLKDCRDWLTESTEHLDREIEFLRSVLFKQKKQYDTARDMLSEAADAAAVKQVAKDLSFAERAAIGLYLKTLAAETASILYQRLNSPTECKLEQRNASVCHLVFPKSKENPAPIDAMRLALQVFPAQDYDSTYNVSTRQLVTVHVTDEGCGDYATPCYVAESRTPASISFVRGAESDKNITPFEYHDWGLKVIGVRAQQTGPAKCELQEILKRSSDTADGHRFCRAGDSPMMLRIDERTVWQRPDESERVSEWLGYLGANSFVSEDGIGVAWDDHNNELQLFGTFTATALGSNEFESFRLSLTKSTESNWRRILRRASLHAVLKALPALSDVYRQSSSVPSQLNLPSGMVFVALTLDSVKPVRIRLYAHPEGHPELITAFVGMLDRTGSLNWHEPRALFMDKLVLLARTVNVEAIRDLASMFTKASGTKTLLGDTLARRDLFEAFFLDLASTVSDSRKDTTDKQSDPVDVQSTLDRYRGYAKALEQDSATTVLGAWQASQENYKVVLDALRVALEGRLRSNLVKATMPLTESLTGFKDEAKDKSKMELLWLFGLSNWDEADEYINDKLAVLVVEALQTFSADGGLFKCWAAKQDANSGSEVRSDSLCAAPQEAVNRIGTQVAQRFMLGSHLKSRDYDEEVKIFRERLNNPPAPLTTQQLLDAAHKIRLAVTKKVERSVNEAWSSMVADIIGRDEGGVLGPLLTALKDETKSADMRAALTELQVNCQTAPLGCEQVLVSLALDSLYRDPAAVLTSGLESHLERTLEALIPRPYVVYGAGAQELSNDSRALAKILADSQSKLTTVFYRAKRDSLRTFGGVVGTAGLVVRESNAFIPSVEVQEGALYLQLNLPAWGGKKGDKILGVNCNSDGIDCVASLEDLSTTEDLQKALRSDLPSAAPSPFIRIERSGSQLTLKLPRAVSYSMAIVPKIPSLDSAHIADVAQLVENVDPRNAAMFQEKIRQTEIKHAVLTATIESLNEAMQFDWRTAYEDEFESFEKACKSLTKIYFLFGDSACEDPIALFRKASDLDLRQISTELFKNIANRTIPLPFSTCTPNHKVHKILQDAAKVACDKLAMQVGDIEDKLKSNNLSAARATAAAMPQVVTQAFGETIAGANQEKVLESVLNVAFAAELLPLQQTEFEFKTQRKQICSKALESLVDSDTPSCGHLKQRYIDALNLDLSQIADEQVTQALKQACVDASQEVELGDINNCNDLKAGLKQTTTDSVKKFLENFKLVRPNCSPQNNVDPILTSAAQSACDMMMVQLDEVESAMQVAHFQRAQNLTVALPRVVAEAFGASLKKQALLAVDKNPRASSYSKEIEEYEKHANRLCVSTRDRAASILGDELPAIDGCNGIGEVLDHDVIENLLQKRSNELQQAARDHAEAELNARAKPIIDAAQVAYNEQKKLLQDAAEGQAAMMLAELRESESRLCRAIDKLFNEGDTAQLELINGAPFTISRPSNPKALCVPHSLSLKTHMNLLGQTVDVTGGLSINTARLRDNALLEQLEAGQLNLASLVDLNWSKFQTEPSLETVLTKKLRTLDEGLSLQHLEARSDKIQVSLQYQPAAFPFAVPITTEISAKGVKVKLGDLGLTLNQAVCHEIRDYILREQPELLPDARILRAPPAYCIKRKLKGLELQVAVDLAEGLGRVELQVFIDMETGMRIVPPDFKQLAAGQLLTQFGLEAVRPVAPFYDSTDGITLYLEGKAETPLGLALQAGFSVSPSRFKFRGPIGLRIPGWYDASVVSLGNFGITYNPENKELSLLGALTVAPGEAMNHLVSVDGRGTVGLKEQKLEVTGNLVVLGLLGVAGTRTTIILPERLFEHTIGTSPMLADIVKLQGELRIQDLKPHPFLTASGEGGLFGADIASMEVELQRNFGGHFDAGLKIPLDESAVTFNVVVEENMGDVTVGTKSKLPVGPFTPTFRMDAGTRSVGVGMKVDVEQIGSLDIGFALPSFASLTPEYVLSLLLDMGLTFHIPSSLATFANDAPEGYSGSKNGSGEQSQGRKADNERQDPEPPIGDYKPAWRMVPVEYCKPFKIGIKLWCEKRIRWEPDFVQGRGGLMAQQAGYSAKTAKHYDVHYNTTIKNYDLLVGTEAGDKRAYVFAKNGGQLWTGKYRADKLANLNTKPYAHKPRQGKNLLVVNTGGEYFGIQSEGGYLDTTNENNKLKGAKSWLQGNNAGGFALRLLPSVAEEQLYNGRTVEQKPIGRRDKWVLLNISKNGDSLSSVHILAHTRDAEKPLTFLALTDLNVGIGNSTDNLARNLNTLKDKLPDTLDQVCPPRNPIRDTESSLGSPCAYLAVGQLTEDTPIAFGLDDTLSDQPTALLATRKEAWLTSVYLPQLFRASSLADVDPIMLLNLMDSLAREPDQLEAMTSLTSAVIDLSGNGRIAVIGSQGNQEILLFSPRNIQINQNGSPKYFMPRRVNMTCVEEFWDRNGHLRPYEETLRAERVNERDALMLSLIHHDVFKKYGFAADPVGSLYRRCNKESRK